MISPGDWSIALDLLGLNEPFECFSWPTCPAKLPARTPRSRKHDFRYEFDVFPMIFWTFLWPHNFASHGPTFDMETPLILRNTHPHCSNKEKRIRSVLNPEIHSTRAYKRLSNFFERAQIFQNLWPPVTFLISNRIEWNLDRIKPKGVTEGNFDIRDKTTVRKMSCVHFCVQKHIFSETGEKRDFTGRLKYCSRPERSQRATWFHRTTEVLL